LISVRSEVQVFPGPPAFAATQLRLGRPFLNEGCCAVAPAKASAKEHSSSGYGAIAQLGERVLCKHEVVGSIPSGSTSLRWLRQLRLGEPDRSEGCRGEARKSEAGPAPTSVSKQFVRETSLRMRDPKQGSACGISDIVKRRSIRVGSRRLSRGPSQSPGHFGARSSQDGRVVNDPVSEA
jgi:hypothetical protein